MVDFEVRAGLRVEAAAVLAGAFSELLVAGRPPEFRGGTSDVVDVAFEVGIFQAGFRLLEDGLVAAGLDDAAFVEGQGTEIAVAKAASVGSEAELDLAQGRDAAFFFVGRVVGAHKGKGVDVIHLPGSQGFCRRILHDEELAVVGFV